MTGNPPLSHLSLTADNPASPALPRAIHRVRLPTSTLLYPITIALWIWLLVPAHPQDPDIWWHLRDAAMTLSGHAWLDRDTFSFTAAAAHWIDHEWLAELPFHAAWQLAGERGLSLLTLGILEFIFFGVFTLSLPDTQKSDTPPTLAIPALATVLASVLATVSFGPRTLLFGWACLVCELLILQRFTAEKQTAIFALPPLFALWINLHGSWLIGLVLLLVFIICGSVSMRVGSIVNRAWTPAQRRRLALVFVLCLGALFVNPYGWHLVAYPFDLAFHQQLNIANVEEWQPLSFQSPRGLALLASVALLFLAQLVRRHMWTLCDLAFAAIGLYAACRHARFLFLAGILVMPLLSRRLSFVTTRTRAQARPAITAALIAALLLLALSIQAKRNRLQPTNDFSTAALAYLKAFPFHGHLFNECLWGGYLAYNLPGIPVFIDSRMDIYERNGTLRDYLDVVRLKDPLALLDRYQIRYVLFEKDTPLVYLLRQTHAWKADYDNGNVVLLERVAAAR